MRPAGIEPASEPWEGSILPLYQKRLFLLRIKHINIFLNKHLNNVYTRYIHYKTKVYKWVYTKYIHIKMPKRKFDVKLRKVGNSFVVTIPRDTIDRFNLKENDYLAIELDPSEINNKEKKHV